MGLIYCITFPSSKQYIGQTRQKFEIRLVQHKSCKDDTLIARAFNKYKDDFKTEILLEINNSLLDEYEIKFINVYNTLTPFGYNSRSGGQNGYYFTNEIKLKCSISQRKDKDNKLPMYMYDYENGYRCRQPGKPERYFNYNYLSKETNFLLANEYLNGKDKLYKQYIYQLPKFITKVIRKDRNGYRCTFPGYEKHFTSMKLSNDEKLILSKNYLKDIMEKVQRLNVSGES